MERDAQSLQNTAKLKLSLIELLALEAYVTNQNKSVETVRQRRA